MGVIAEGTLSPEDLLRGVRLMWRKQGAISLMLPGIGSLILLATLVSYFGGEAELMGLVKGVLIGGFMLSLHWLTPWLGSRNLQKKSPSSQGSVSFDFREDGYFFRSPHAEAFVKWDAIAAWAEDSHMFVLYTSPNAGNFIPKRFFANPSFVDSARELLAKAIVKKK